MENEKRKELTNETVVRVYNEFGGTVTYRTSNVMRTFRPNTYRDVELKELRELIIQEGRPGVFNRGYLMIKDGRVREDLGLDPLGEYNLDEVDIGKLLEEGDITKLEEYLQYTSDYNLDKTLRVAVELPIKDLNRANLLYAYSGTNVLDIIQEKEEDKAPETGARKRIDGRNPATPKRGRVIPN